MLALSPSGRSPPGLAGCAGHPKAPVPKPCHPSHGDTHPNRELLPRILRSQRLRWGEKTSVLGEFAWERA